MKTYYKVLGPHGEACHGGSGRWFLPKGRRPGKWMPLVANPEPCERGYHLVEADHVLAWISNNTQRLFVAEARGTCVSDTSKVAVSQARLLREVSNVAKWLYLFAADCAERVLPLFECEYPNDDRPRKAIDAARRFARGEIDDAARDAARAAAGAAAWAAARAATRAAAGAAAWDAAGDAAWDAARDAARAWQIKRLRYYLRKETV